MRNIIILAAFSACASPQSAVRSDAAPAGPRIHDHTAAFLQFWETARNLERDEAYEVFQKVLVSAFPAFYEYKIAGWTERGVDPRDRVHSGLADFAEIEPVYRKVSAELPGVVRQQFFALQQQLQGFGGDFDVHIVHGFREMDGGTRELDDSGVATFIFGADAIARYYGADPDLAFLTHELFHFYVTVQSIFKWA